MSDELEFDAHRATPVASSAATGCLAVLVILAVLGAAAGYVGVTQAIGRARRPVRRSAPDYPGPGQGEVAFEVTEGDSATDDRPQPQGGRRRQERRRLRRGRRGRPALAAASRSASTAAEQMCRRARSSVLVDPDNIVQAPDRPGGLRGRPDRAGARRGHQLHRGGSSRRSSTTRPARPARTTPTATPRATCSRRPTTSSRTPTPSRSCTTMVDRWSPGRRRRRPRGRPTSWATRPAR